MTEFEKFQRYLKNMGNRNTGWVPYDSFTGSSQTYMPQETYEEPAPYEYDMNPAAPPYEYDMNPATAGSIGNIGGYNFSGSVVDEPGFDKYGATIEDDPGWWSNIVKKYKDNEYGGELPPENPFLKRTLERLKNTFSYRPTKGDPYDDYDFPDIGVDKGIRNMTVDELKNEKYNPELSYAPTIGITAADVVNTKTPQNFSFSKYQGPSSEPEGDVSKKKGWDLSNLLPGGILRAIAGNFSDSPQEKFNREYFAGEGQPGVYDGRIGGLGGGAHNLFGGKNVSYAFGPGLEVGGQKRIDTVAKTIASMPQKWSQLKEGTPEEQARYAKKLAFHQNKLRVMKNQLAAYNKNLQIDTGRDPQPSGAGIAVGDGGAGGVSKPSWGGTGSVEAYDKSQQAIYDRSKERHTGGNWGAAPGTPGAWSPGARDGGRIGYAFAGPVVGEQETDFIEGPQGGEEFQETVVEGQEQPSREQLEALAMEIFQLPLEELDEQQLLVVYQAAMQGQPMEEDFQENVQFADQGQPMEGNIREEDVQFAAGGGRIGFKYGGLASLL